MSTYIYTYIVYIHIQLDLYIHMSTYIYTYIIYIHIHIQLDLYIHMSTYIYTYIVYIITLAITILQKYSFLKCF